MPSSLQRQYPQENPPLCPRTPPFHRAGTSTPLSTTWAGGAWTTPHSRATRCPGACMCCAWHASLHRWLLSALVHPFAVPPAPSCSRFTGQPDSSLPPPCRAGWRASMWRPSNPRHLRWCPPAATNPPPQRCCCARRCWPLMLPSSCPPHWPRPPFSAAPPLAALPAAAARVAGWLPRPPAPACACWPRCCSAQRRCSLTTATFSTTASAWG